MQTRILKIQRRQNGKLAVIGQLEVPSFTITDFDLSNQSHVAWINKQIESAASAQILAQCYDEPDVAGNWCKAEAIPDSVDSLIAGAPDQRGEYQRSRKVFFELVEQILAVSAKLSAQQKTALTKYLGSLDAIPLLKEGTKATLRNLLTAVDSVADKHGLDCHAYSSKVAAALAAEPIEDEFEF